MSTITPMTAVAADLVSAPTPLSTPVSSMAKTTPDTTAKKDQAAKPTAAETAAKLPQNTANAAQRLIIEAGAKTGVFVYTILDRTTGQVLVQIPREEVVRLANRPDYSAGAVIDTKA